jgi:hypothetical protein
MASTEKLTTHQKALEINLDRSSYGSFAEIGAGQEVARWFLVVGGASGTVAKSISAYDKEVSDDLYGSSARYVSSERLEAMLDSEWTQLIKQLGPSRGATTRFFAFVDTISARNYAGTNEPHGWIGLRFQLETGGPPNEIVLHINLLDRSNPLEQEAIGILGVNLIYAAFYQGQTKDSLLDGLAQDIQKRIEIDLVELRGPAFEGWDQRAILAQLVRTGLAAAVYFPASGPPVPPIETLHRKAVVLVPGSFRLQSSTHAAMQILSSGLAQLRDELKGKESSMAGFFCLSVLPLWDTDTPPEAQDLLQRIDDLHARGGDVLLFHERELYSMTALVNRHTKECVRFVVGLSLLVRIWEYRYVELKGNFLEALSRLLMQNVRIYAFPMKPEDLQQAIDTIKAKGWRWDEVNGWVSARQLHPPSPLNHLYEYLLADNFLIPMEAPAAETVHALDAAPAA